MQEIAIVELRLSAIVGGAGTCFGATNKTSQEVYCANRAGKCSCGTASVCSCNQVGPCCHVSSTTANIGNGFVGKEYVTDSGACDNNSFNSAAPISLGFGSFALAVVSAIIAAVFWH
jgi:hypothetical protein